MRLGNSVVIAYGLQRAALYNLAKNCIQRIPLEMADVLKGRPIDIARLPIRWANYLAEQGFLINEEPGSWMPYSSDFAFPRVPRFHTLSIDADAIRLAGFRDWLHAGREILSMTHIVIIANSAQRQAGIEFLIDISNSRIGGTFEILLQEQGAPPVGTIFDSKMVPRLQRVASVRTHLLADYICADTQVYSFTKKYSELIGNIFCNAAGELFPHVDEKVYLLGTTCQPLADVLRSRPYLVAGENNKDHRDRCKHCELRYVCINPFVYRSVGSDIRSAPSNCPYDPCSDAPQNSLFETA